ncbi:MAG: SDR family NAD(P)-dependent oxidoreductase [Thermoguttaceae bacterium]
MSASSFRLDGQIAVVTGASGGIGHAVALTLAKVGATVVLHANQHPEKALEVVREIENFGGKAAFFSADLRKIEEQDHFLDQVLGQFPNISIWVHAAGIDLMSPSLKPLSFEEKLAELIAVDLLAPVRMSRKIGGMMKQSGKGVIVLFSWDGIELGLAGETAQLYGIVKGAIAGFVPSLAHTLAPEVRVNTISPGWIATRWGQTAPEQFQLQGKQESLLNRWGQTQEVANAVLFLVSDAASFVNAQNVKVNGGLARGKNNIR